MPVPAGGLTDGLARVTADFLSKRMGQAVVVENKPGAASTIGVDFVAKAPADGYTLLFMGGELPVVPAVRSNLPYKYDELTYLIRGFVVQPLVVVGPTSPFKSTAELVAHMKANPGKLRWGSTGVGAIAHLGAAMFEGSAGVKGVHVPYPGAGPIYQDLLAGTIDFFAGGTSPLPEGIKVLARWAASAARSTRTSRRSTRAASRARTGTSGSASWHRPTCPSPSPTS